MEVLRLKNLGSLHLPEGRCRSVTANSLILQKLAIATWRDGTETSRVELVNSYSQSVPGFSPPETIVRHTQSAHKLPLL
jgi:hypothetical protein